MKLFPPILLVAVFAASAAQAEIAVTTSPTSAPVLGTVVRGSSATTFSVATNGAVTRTSGDAIRLSNASVTTPTVSINCGLLNLPGLCALRQIRVTVQPAGTTGQATITKLRVGSLTGATYATGSAPAESSSITFDLNPIGLLGTASFKIGMDMLLPGNTTTTVNNVNYTVTATLL
jgi:hypothetical protein